MNLWNNKKLNGNPNGSDGNKQKRPRQVLLLVILCCIPLILVIFFGAGNYVKCTNCGDDSTRFFICAKGTSNGVEYTSCVGPAGILGFGCDSRCWPTECMRIKKSEGITSLKGCVTYYNEIGCIDRSDVKSYGKYSESTSCIGISCSGTKYVENTAETTQASTQTSCFGMSCGEDTAANSENYNKKMPRQFTRGCWLPNE